MPSTADRTTGQIPTPSERLSPRAQLEHVVREANRLLAAMGAALRDTTGEGAPLPTFKQSLALESNRITKLGEAQADTDAPNFGQVKALLSETIETLKDEDLPDRMR